MLKKYSHSSLRTYRDCPRQFKFKYIDRVKTVRKLSADTHLGNVVHRVLRQIYKLGADGIEMPLDKMEAMYEEAWSTIDLNTITAPSDYYTIDDYQRIGRDILRAHYEKYRPFKPGSLLGTELRCSFTLPGTDIRLQAIIDRLIRRNDGVVEICDYKTGQRLPKPSDADYFYQMGIYHLAVQQNYPEIKEVEVVQHMLRSDERVGYRYSEEELDRLIEDIRIVVLETMRALHFDDFPTSEGNHCRYCDYFELCPAKRHRVILEKEEEATDERETAEIAREVATRYIEVYENEKILKSEKDALKADLARLSKELGYEVIKGDGGQVKVSRRVNSKFVTKSRDADAFARLNMIVRDMGLDAYLVVDATSLMKDVYRARRLPEDQLEKLKEYVIDEEEARVTVKIAKPDDDDGDEDD
jgi:RecB family exonuclease